MLASQVAQLGYRKFAEWVACVVGVVHEHFQKGRIFLLFG